MAPLLLVGFGMTFVVLVIRTHGVDIVPDSVGLALYAWGLWKLAAGSRTLVVACALAGIGSVAALLDLISASVSADASVSIDFATSISVASAITAGAWGLGSQALDGSDRAGRLFQLIAVLAAVGLAGFVAGWVTYPADHSRALDILSGSQLLGLFVMVGYIVLLTVCAGRPWAQPAPRLPTAQIRTRQPRG